MSEKRKITILYVDDEETNLFLLRVTFESKYKVITALSGEEGLEKLDDNKGEIIVVISDMSMPSMNGIEFIKKAKEKHKNISYFILTGYDYNDQIDQALKASVIQKFFTKPFDSAQIEDAIQEAYFNMNNG
jgi:response regulator RpfG family c-di-GMP phosphodiesterase